MKEFIFIWSIENISYSWHKTTEVICSPNFTAGPLQNSVWRLDLYPRGARVADYFALYLTRMNCGGRLSVNFELSCTSVENSPLQSCTFPESVWSFKQNITVFGHPRFMSRHEVFARKNLYMPQDVLTLRCRMWKDEGVGDVFGQSFGRTHLQIERILSVEYINLKTTEEKIVDVHLNRHNTSLISINVLHCKDSMRVVINPENVKNIKYSVLKLSFMEKATGKILYVHTSSWLGSPTEEIWRLLLLSKLFDAGNQDSIENNVELLSEIVYTTGEKTKYLDNNKPYPSILSNLISKYLMSFIPSGNLFDCPRISQDMWNLYLEHVRCDLELMTKTTSFFVHKIVLCARSPVFLAMLTGDMKEKRNDCIEMEDIMDDISKKFLFFLYTDSFEDIEWEAAIGLYYAAYKYHIERLKFLCCSFFLKNIDTNNACELLLLADRHHDADFKRRVEDFILRNDEMVLSTSAWNQLFDEQSHLSTKTMLLRYDKEKGKENATETYEEQLSMSPEVFDDFRSAYEGKDNAFETYEEKLSLHPEVFDDFRSAYEGKIFSDIIIKAKDATFYAHKSVLCASSSALKEAFAKDLNAKPSETLKMEDLEDETVSRLLLFLYSDSFEDIEWDTALKLYHAAYVYQIQRLKIKCSCFFLENLGTSNASDLLLLAHQHSDNNLKSVVQDFIFLHDKEVFGSQEWAEFSKANLLLANETMCLKHRKSKDLSY